MIADCPGGIRAICNTCPALAPTVSRPPTRPWAAARAAARAARVVPWVYGWATGQGLSDVDTCPACRYHPATLPLAHVEIL